MPKKKSDCQLEGRFKSCCCSCKNRVQLLDNDNALEQVGWGCAALFVLEGKAVCIGDFEHGLCEMWIPFAANRVGLCKNDMCKLSDGSCIQECDGFQFNGAVVER